MKKQASLTNTTCLFAIVACSAALPATSNSQTRWINDGSNSGVGRYIPDQQPVSSAQQNLRQQFQQQNATTDWVNQQTQQNQARQRAESDAQRAKWNAQSQQSQETWQQTYDKLGQTVRNATKPTDNQTSPGQGGYWVHGQWESYHNQPASSTIPQSDPDVSNQQENNVDEAVTRRQQEQERQAELHRQEQLRLAELQRSNERTVARYDDAIVAVQNQATRAEYEAQVEAIAAEAGSPRENFANGIVDEVIDKVLPSVGVVSPSMVKDVLGARDGKEVAGAVATSVAMKVLTETIPVAGTAILALTSTESAHDDYSRFYRWQTMNRVMQLLDNRTCNSFTNKTIMAPDTAIEAPK